jgi:hypothetical protein
VRRWDPLNDRQLRLLRRIGEEDERVGSSDAGLATSVYALRARGLVTTPRRAGGWQAEITDAGRFYLEHGQHPDRPPPQPARKSARASVREELRSALKSWYGWSKPLSTASESRIRLQRNARRGGERSMQRGIAAFLVPVA